MALSRRALFRRGAGVTFCLALGPVAGIRAAAGSAPLRMLNAYVHVGADDLITIHCPASEMGQGVVTALPLIVAEELDADWDRVRVTPSPPAGDAYGDPLFINMIYTVASRSVSAYFERLRLFGAQARRMLIVAAARHWGVAFDALNTRPSRIAHGATGRFLSYAEAAALVRPDDPVPELTAADLKPPSRFRLIGTGVRPRLLDEKVRGTLAYSIDVHPAGLVYAAVLRPPLPGMTLASVDQAAAAAARGVLRVERRGDVVAVIADSYPRALAARALLKAQWARDPAQPVPDSERLMAEHERAARDTGRAGFPWDRAGEPEARLAADGGIVERIYRTDFMYHGGIEPLNATVSVSADGTAAEAWVGTQAPWYTVRTVAAMTGVAETSVTLRRMPMGGAFGRRSLYAMDFVEDAAWLAARVRRPVQVIWDREQDLALGYFRPMTCQVLRARVDAAGAITLWHHRVACEDPVRRHEPLLWDAWQQVPIIGMLGSEHTAEGGAPTADAYDLPQRLVEYVAMDTGVRVYAMRGVGALPNKFAMESFIDELAQQSGRDPLAFRLGLLHRSARARRVLETAAAMAGWKRPPPGRGLGIAYSHYTGSLLACAAEVGVDHATGAVRVHRLWFAVDCGIVIQPDNVAAQLEGGAMYGIGNALSERITIADGAVQQRNFDDYRVPDPAAAPEIEVHIVRSDAPPTGIGEIGTVLAPAALANAFAALTGRRLRHLPMTPERVRAALSG
jgi:isoquinoline 1-oxidoreductase beta subunit